MYIRTGRETKSEKEKNGEKQRRDQQQSKVRHPTLSPTAFFTVPVCTSSFDGFGKVASVVVSSAAQRITCEFLMLEKISELVEMDGE